MKSIHSQIAKGEGTRGSPFVLISPGYATAAATEREVVEQICGAAYDAVLIRREYHDNDLCGTVVRDGVGERTIWFDLSAARSGSELMRDFIKSPEAQALNRRTAEARAKLIKDISQPRDRGCLLVFGLILVGVATFFFLLTGIAFS